MNNNLPFLPYNIQKYSTQNFIKNRSAIFFKVISALNSEIQTRKLFSFPYQQKIA